MINKKISSYRELQATIDELAINKIKQEELIKANVKGIKEALTPINLLKDYIKHTTAENGFLQEILKAGLSVGTRFVVDKIVRAVKG